MVMSGEILHFANFRAQLRKRQLFVFMLMKQSDCPTHNARLPDRSQICITLMCPATAIVESPMHWNSRFFIPAAPVLQLTALEGTVLAGIKR
jgi:hypothetical protein